MTVWDSIKYLIIWKLYGKALNNLLLNTLIDLIIMTSIKTS